MGKTHGIVRFDDRRAKATIAEPDKTALHPERVDENANDVASFVNLLRLGRISGPGIIKSRDHFDRARVPCLLSERLHQWEHEENCQNAVKYLFWFHDAYSHVDVYSLLPKILRCVTKKMQIIRPAHRNRRLSILQCPVAEGVSFAKRDYVANVVNRALSFG